MPVNTEGLTPAETGQLVALHSTDGCRPRKGECGLCVGPDSLGQLTVQCIGFQPPDIEEPVQDDEGNEFGRWDTRELQACRDRNKVRQTAESIEAILRAKKRS